MGAAFEWLGQLAEWVGRFFPRVVIVCDNMALLAYVRGTRRVVQGKLRADGKRRGRLAVYWPFWTEAYLYSVNEQTLLTNPQNLTTQDRKSVVVQAVLVFSIIDVEKFGAEVYEAEESLGETLGEAIAKVVRGHTLATLLDEAERIDAELATAARRATKRFGIEVAKMRVTSLVQTRAISLFSANFQPDRAQGARPV
jgi:regulator of protease activity HflC (stomatin/prohibitin superfamily)